MPIPFPQETLDSIIDFAWNDRKFLANWALVHPSCVSSSRHHLFNTVHITLHNCDAADAWLEILNAPTATAPQHVQHIEVRGGPQMIPFKDAAVYFMHPKLTKAGKLSLEGITSDGDMLDPSGLSTFQVLVLADISVRSYMELFSMLSGFRSLTRLDIKDVWVTNLKQPSYDSSHRTPPFPRAFTLSVHIADSLQPFLQWLICSNVAFTELSPVMHNNSDGDPSLTKVPPVGTNLIKVHPDGELSDQDYDRYSRLIRGTTPPPCSFVC